MTPPFHLLLPLLVLPAVLSGDPTGGSKSCRKPLVEITVSPIVNKKVLRVMDISWEVDDVKPGDWVGLYNATPTWEATPIFNTPVSGPQGWVRTDIQEGRLHSEPVFTKTCSKHWAAYWRADSTVPVASHCLGTNPRWMEESREKIKNLRLRDAFFPGTHDSASFILSSTPFKENRYQKYVYTQDETIMDQLLHGARYLDFRVGHYKGVYWLNHDIVRVHPLEFGLKDLKTFLQNTNEIIILDLHRFPVGFKEKETHTKFVAYLESELSEFMAPRHLSWDATLGEIWASNKRLIVAYNDRSVVSDNHNLLWWPVNQKWANVLELQKLHDYVKNVIDYRPSYPWAAMVQLTPTAWTVITDKHKGLRRMADTVNHNVTSWFRGEWGKYCHAVAVDFLRSSGVVEAAIRWNKRRANRSSCD